MPSQFVKKETLVKAKGNRVLSVASKIIIQMNAKAGYSPWLVAKQNAYFKGKNFMYGSFSISKGSNGYALAFVGTINNDCSKVYSWC